MYTVLIIFLLLFTIILLWFFRSKNRLQQQRLRMKNPKSAVKVYINNEKYIGEFQNAGVLFSPQFLKNTQEQIHFKEPTTFTQYIEDYYNVIQKKYKKFPNY